MDSIAVCMAAVFPPTKLVLFGETSITHQKIRQSTKECTERCHMHQTLDFSLVYYWQDFSSLKRRSSKRHDQRTHIDSIYTSQSLKN
jgi:hypothetical protein